MAKERSILIGADAHLPFASRRALDLFIHIGIECKVDEIILAGDWVDFHNISKYGRNPSVEDALCDEIESTVTELTNISREFSKAKKHYIVGNHENRLDSFIQNRAHQFYSILELEKLLCLKKLDYNIVPYGPYQAHLINEDLVVRHEPPPGMITTMLGKAMCSVIHAHTHKIYEYHSVGLNGKRYDLFGLGHLADCDHVVLKYPKYVPQWQLGAMLLRTDGNETNFQNFAIKTGKKYSAIIDGKTYYA